MVCPSSVRSRCRRLLNDSLTAREEGQLSARTPSTAFTASPRSVPTEQHAPSSDGSEESEGGGRARPKQSQRGPMRTIEGAPSARRHCTFGTERPGSGFFAC